MDIRNRILGRAELADRLQPVVLGADSLGYSYARCFHEAYGVRSIVVGTEDVKFVSKSRFVDFRQVRDVDREDRLLALLFDLADELGSGKVPLLLGSGDWYARMFSQNKGRLSERFVVPYIDFPLLDRITQKGEFYRICEELGMPYPKTWSFPCGDDAPDALPVDEFAYPLIAKPSNSARYHYAEFEGKRKVFTVEAPEELADIFAKLKASVYDRELIVQEFVPGDDAALHSLTCFCAEGGDMRVACCGHVLLEDHGPAAVGNPVCIMGERNDELIEQAARFLKHVGYEGFANFDVKYDERDGRYKFFEVNTRPGRNTFYLTMAGVNFVTLLVDHYILGERIERRVADDPFLFRMVPDYVIRRTVQEPERGQALELIRAGRDGCPLFARGDTLAQGFWARLTYYNQIRKFKRYVWDKQA